MQSYCHCMDCIQLKFLSSPSPKLLTSGNLDLDNSTCHNALWQAAKSCSDTDGWPCITYSICAVKEKFLDLDGGKENEKRREKMRTRTTLQARHKAAGRMDWYRCCFITSGDKRQGDHNSDWSRLEMGQHVLSQAFSALLESCFSLQITRGRMHYKNALQNLLYLGPSTVLFEVDRHILIKQEFSQTLQGTDH